VGKRRKISIFALSHRIFAEKIGGLLFSGMGLDLQKSRTGDSEKTKKMAGSAPGHFSLEEEWGMEVRDTILASPERRRKVMM